MSIDFKPEPAFAESKLEASLLTIFSQALEDKAKEPFYHYSCWSRYVLSFLCLLVLVWGALSVGGVGQGQRWFLGIRRKVRKAINFIMCFHRHKVFVCNSNSTSSSSSSRSNWLSKLSSFFAGKTLREKQELLRDNKLHPFFVPVLTSVNSLAVLRSPAKNRPWLPRVKWMKDLRSRNWSHSSSKPTRSPVS